MGREHFKCKEYVFPIVPTFFHLFFTSFLLYLSVRWARASHTTQVGVRGQCVAVSSPLWDIPPAPSLFITATPAEDEFKSNNLVRFLSSVTSSRALEQLLLVAFSWVYGRNAEQMAEQKDSGKMCCLSTKKQAWNSKEDVSSGVSEKCLYEGHTFDHLVYPLAVWGDGAGHLLSYAYEQTHTETQINEYELK